MVTFLKEKKAIKKFVLQTSTEVDGPMGVVKSALSKTHGEIIFEKKLTTNSVFCLISFSDPTTMVAWETLAKSLLGSAVGSNGKYKFIERIFPRTLIIEDETEENVREKLEEIKKIISNYNKGPDREAAVLDIRKLGDDCYRVVLIFISEQRRSEFEQTFGVHQ